jgi:hypothetical protein
VELDDLKFAWHALDDRLERQNALLWRQLKTTATDAVARRLRPISRGQVVQIAAGVLMTCLAVPVWLRPGPSLPLGAAAVVMHVYGIALIVFGARMRWLIACVDHAQPVVAIQRQVADVQRLQVLGGIALGLPWWVLWVPGMMVAFDLVFGVDLYRHAPLFVVTATAASGAGWLATVAFYRRARRSGWARVSRWMDAALVGPRLRAAARALDDIREFEAD